MEKFLKTQIQHAVWILILAIGMVACAQFEGMDPVDLSSQEAIEKANSLNSGNYLNAKLAWSEFNNAECEGPYDIGLDVEALGDGLYQWTWIVGSREGSQAISHWDITLPACLDLENIISASYNNDGSWNDFDPKLEVDNSMKNACDFDPTEGQEVLKFDAGSQEGDFVYYRLVIDKNLSVDLEAISYYKSGSQTGCGALCYPGIGCEVIIEEEEDCYKDETAWSAGSRYSPRGNWATYTEYSDGLTVDLLAGQTHKIGTVSFEADGAQVKITIELNDEGAFQDVADNVKIQGYNGSVPGKNPNPGGFTTHKGTASGSSYSVTVDKFDFYGIHIDAARLVDCPEEEIY